MVTTSRLHTAEDLWRMPGDEPWEIWNGELRRVPGSGDRATRTALAIGASLFAYERQTDLGIATSSDGSFVLSTHPDTVVIPDAAFVRWERIPDHHDPAKYFPVAPDLAVEVQSPTDEPKEMASKRELYAKAGVPLVCWVDPVKRTVSVYHDGELAALLTEAGVLDGGEVLPRLRIAVADIFPRSRPR